jgi:hypothetical protein
MPKYKVNFNVTRILKLYKAGKKISEIVQAIGYPRGRGQNRCRAALEKAGVYRSARE